MIAKNHDYGEAWRDMRVSSLTDLISKEYIEVKQIEKNNGSTIISEGIDANYLDMLNYAVFALIKLEKMNKIISTFLRVFIGVFFNYFRTFESK